MIASKVEARLSAHGDSAVPAGPDAFIHGLPLTSFVQDPLRTCFNVFKTLAPPQNGRNRNKLKQTGNQSLKTKVPNLPLPVAEGNSTERSSNWSECSEATPQLNLPPLSSILDPKFLISYNPTLAKDFEIADKEAEKTKALIDQLKTEIKSYNQKPNLSAEEIEKLEASKERLGKSVKQFEEIAEKITRSPEITEAEGYTTEDPKSPEETEDKTPRSPKIFGNTRETPNSPKRQQPLLQSLDSPEDEIEVKSTVSEKSITSHRTKLKEEFRQITAQLESEIEMAGCGLSTVDTTPRSVNSETCLARCRRKEEMGDIHGSLATSYGSPDLSRRADSELVSSMSDRLSESYHMQERLATENKSLEDNRFKLQEELMMKESETEKLQRRVEALNTELRILKRENLELEGKVQATKPKGGKLLSQTEAKAMDGDLSGLQSEVNRLKTELSFLHTEREELMLKKMNLQSSLESCLAIQKHQKTDEKKWNSDDEKLDYNSMTEKNEFLEEKNRQLRRQLDRALDENKQLGELQKSLESAHHEVFHLAEVCEQKEQRITELTKQVNLSKEEVDEVRILLDDKGLELQEYRNKYLLAQQRVEELSKELEQKESEMDEVRNNAAADIRAVKAQYHDKIANVEHLSSMLKEMQGKLQESQQQRILLEREVGDAKREIIHLKETNVMLQKTLENERSNRFLDSSERQKMENLIADAETKQNELHNERNEMQSKIARLEEAMTFTEQRLNEKVKESSELTKQLDAARSETSRQLIRSKERSDSVRRGLQVQIADLERELAATRASAKAAHKERDEVRLKLQKQIDSLTESLEEGQNRWKGLQAHVVSLQNSLHPQLHPNSQLLDFPLTQS